MGVMVKPIEEMTVAEMQAETNRLQRQTAKILTWTGVIAMRPWS